MRLEWTDYRREDGAMVDSWLDEAAVAMTGLDMLWDDYWQAVLADGKNFPGCKDFCKVIRENGTAIAVICFGWYGGVVTVSEIVVAPQRRGQGVGTQILRELISLADRWIGETIEKFCAVIFASNLPSQRAFTKAGFVFDYADEGSWNYVYNL